MEGERGTQILGCVLCAEVEGAGTERSGTRRLVGFCLIIMCPFRHCGVCICVCVSACALHVHTCLQVQ